MKLVDFYLSRNTTMKLLLGKKNKIVLGQFKNSHDLQQL